MKLLAGFEMGKISLMLHLGDVLQQLESRNRNVGKHQRTESRSLACLRWPLIRTRTTGVMRPTE
jgi:hypothetical protein